MANDESWDNEPEGFGYDPNRGEADHEIRSQCSYGPPTNHSNSSSNSSVSSNRYSAHYHQYKNKNNNNNGSYQIKQQQQQYKPQEYVYSSSSSDDNDNNYQQQQSSYNQHKNYQQIKHKQNRDYHQNKQIQNNHSNDNISSAPSVSSYQSMISQPGKIRSSGKVSKPRSVYQPPPSSRSRYSQHRYPQYAAKSDNSYSNNNNSNPPKNNQYQNDNDWNNESNLSQRNHDYGHAQIDKMRINQHNNDNNNYQDNNDKWRDNASSIPANYYEVVNQNELSEHQKRVNFNQRLKQQQKMRNRAKYDQVQRLRNNNSNNQQYKPNANHNVLSSDDNQSHHSYHSHRSYHSNRSNRSHSSDSRSNRSQYSQHHDYNSYQTKQDSNLNIKPYSYQPRGQNNHRPQNRSNSELNDNNGGHNGYQRNRSYQRQHNGFMRNRNINGFNCGQGYNPKPNATMVVRMPQEHISWLSIDEVDLLELIKKLLTKQQKEIDPNRTKFEYVNQPISYNELHQFLMYEFGKEFEKVSSSLNNLIFTEEIEEYISRKGKIGTKECIIWIINDRELIPKEIGKILHVKNGKYKAMTYDSRELDAECESIEEAKELLLRQPQFDTDLNWRSKFHVALRNFKQSFQIFRSLEAELDASEASSLNDLYLLPIKVIKELNDAFIKARNYHGYNVKNENDGMTFHDFILAVDNNDGLLFSTKQLIGDEGIDIMYNKIDAAIQRSHLIHDGYGQNRGILKAKHSIPIILTCDKKEIYVSDRGEVKGINVGALVEFECGQDFKARNIRYLGDNMVGFDNYVDVIAMKQRGQYHHPLNNNDYNNIRGKYGGNRRRLPRFDKFDIKEIIENELKLSKTNTFDMHQLPDIVEATLNIEWDPKKFGFPTLREIFEDHEIKKICRLDNASSTALVSTIEKSKEIPTMEFIKNGFEKVLLTYGDPIRGYRMKKRGSKKMDIRAHFARLTGKALKPKAWFNINVKDLIRRCDDIIDIDFDTEPDGVWLLFLKKQRQYH